MPDSAATMNARPRVEIASATTVSEGPNVMFGEADRVDVRLMVTQMAWAADIEAELGAPVEFPLIERRGGPTVWEVEWSG